MLQFLKDFHLAHGVFLLLLREPLDIDLLRHKLCTCMRDIECSAMMHESDSPLPPVVHVYAHVHGGW